MPHKFFLLSKPGADYHLGEYWREETMEEHLGLCEHETTLDVQIFKLRKEGEILDAGCGAGRWTIYLRSRGFRVLGLDRSLEGLRRARTLDPGIPAVVGDVCHKPFIGDRFETVLSSGVVEHFEKGPGLALAEARRVLAPGGVLLISVPYNSPLRRFLYHPLHVLIRWLTSPFGVTWEFAEYRFTAREMRSLLESCGFEWEGAFPDDYRPPKAKGIWVDYNQILGKKGRMWELNAPGRAVQKIFNAISPWISCAGVLCVVRKPLG
jgi:SAM-dependent methyltransferase